jgi:hypothetical protein
MQLFADVPNCFERRRNGGVCCCSRSTARGSRDALLDDCQHTRNGWMRCGGGVTAGRPLNLCIDSVDKQKRGGLTGASGACAAAGGTGGDLVKRTAEVCQKSWLVNAGLGTGTAAPVVPRDVRQQEEGGRRRKRRLFWFAVQFTSDSIVASCMGWQFLKPFVQTFFVLRGVGKLQSAVGGVR